MQHPLLLARPADPFLRLRLADGTGVEDYVVDGDHVAFIRRGRRAEETWVSALGDDPARIRGLIEVLRVHGLDGVHVHDHIYDTLPPSLQGPDPGHWSLWELPPAECALVHPFVGVSGSAGAHSARGVVRLRADDSRIDALLVHSDSAYIRAHDPKVTEWLGIEEDGELVAIGARMPGESDRADPAVISGRDATAHLVSICTHPDHRGRGFAKTITRTLAARALADGAAAVWLEMYADNQSAARVYRDVGFVEVGRYRSALLAEHLAPGA